jgi:hypothetical protein
MEKHLHAEHAWRARVDGRSRGAGVLLDERHVLTCAHVAGDANEQVPVRSAACRPEWSIAARVAPGSPVYQDNGTRRGDVALLVLDEATACGVHTRLWCAPSSGGRVRAHGFPRTEPYGIPVDAELAGDGGRGGELGVLHDGPELVQRLVRRVPPASLVIVGVDRAEDPGRLIREMLRPLTARHQQAARAVWQAPIDLGAARLSVKQYIAEVERRIGEAREDERDHG